MRNGTTYSSSLDKYSCMLHILPWILKTAAVPLQFNPSAVSARLEQVFSGWQTPPQCDSTDMIVLPSQQPIAAAPTRLRQLWKPEAFVCRWSMIKTPISGQLNNNCRILFRKPLRQHGYHDQLRQVWAGLSRMRSLCMQKLSTTSITRQPAGSAAAVTNTANIIPYYQRWKGQWTVPSSIL